MTKENTTREFWVQEPGVGVVREGRLPAMTVGDVRVRTLYSGISRGTESLVFRGEVPASQHDAMRCPFQDGDFPAPVKYGYMNVGVVEAGEGDWAAKLIGRSVFCLPESLPPARAVLAANVETAITGMWDAAPRVGDRIVVVGAGVVGMLTAWLARGIAGTEVTLVDPNGARAEAAGVLGIPFTTDMPDGAGADVVLHASGNPAGLAAALSAVGVEGRVVELSWFGDQLVSLPLGEAFHSKRITIRSSQVGRIPPTRSARWDYARRMALALRLLQDPVLDMLITGESPFHELPSVMERLARGGDDTLCHRIRYDSP
jgi:threonine dehydrogenase-like Zn-dependent dehydrogenase